MGCRDSPPRVLCSFRPFVRLVEELVWVHVVLKGDLQIPLGEMALRKARLVFCKKLRASRYQPSLELACRFLIEFGRQDCLNLKILNPKP